MYANKKFQTQKLKRKNVCLKQQFFNVTACTGMEQNQLVVILNEIMTKPKTKDNKNQNKKIKKTQQQRNRGREKKSEIINGKRFEINSSNANANEKKKNFGI